MYKYEIKDGEWKVKTAQNAPELDYENDSIFAYTPSFLYNKTAIRRLDPKKAKELCRLLYGENGNDTNGPWIQYLRDTIKQFRYLDLDYEANIEATIADLEEVRVLNLQYLKQMEDSYNLEPMEKWNPTQQREQRGRDGQAQSRDDSRSRSTGRSPRTPSDF
jgi:hypothetical protein